jgi:hypothetical protein
MNGSPAQVVAGCFALCAFAVAILAGLSAGNDAATVLLRAILSMAACYVVGLVIGLLCSTAIRSGQDSTDTGAPGGESAANAPKVRDQQDDPIVV